MWMTISVLVVGLAGAAFGIWGVFLAYKQKFMADQLKIAMDKIKKRREHEIWTQIGIDLTVFDALDEAKKFLAQRSGVDEEVGRRIESARRATIDLYRLLLCEAAAAEPVFNKETIRKWLIAGRLENEWRVRAAMRLLPTNEVPDNGLNGLSTPQAPGEEDS